MGHDGLHCGVAICEGRPCLPIAQATPRLVCVPNPLLPRIPAPSFVLVHSKGPDPEIVGSWGTRERPDPGFCAVMCGVVG